MNKNILNEINRYREIMGLPLLDEEKKSESYKYSWGNGGSGNVNLGNDDVTPGNLSIANNIGSANLSLFYGSMQPTVQPVSKTETKVITMPSFTLVGGDLNYNDNCVLPNVSEGESKEKFNNIVNSFVNYINNGGFDQIQSITIQGSADSGTPSLSGNDHVEAGYSEPFNGETDKYKMNQFLADERAKQYGLLVNESVKKSTGKDLTNKFQYKPGINHWTKDGNPSKRGEQFRSITFNVNAPELKVADKVETSSTITPVDENHKSTTIVITKPDGTTTEKQGIQFITQSGASSKNRVQGFYPNDESLSEIVEIPTGVVEGEIVNNRLRLNGKDICSFSSNKQHTKNNPSYTCKVTGHRGVERDGIILVKDYYFNLKTSS